MTMPLQPFHRLDAIAAPLLRPDVDTDALAPSRFRPRDFSKYGFRDALFMNWRFNADGTENPDFVLNQEPYRDAGILVAGPNFGCGSSRETAVWALRDFGIRAIVAPDFGSIFQTNCVRNGLLPIVLDAATHRQLVEETFGTDGTPRLGIDLDACEIHTPAGRSHGFAVDDRDRRLLRSGLDPIGETLQLRDRITDHRTRDRLLRPWIYTT
jgi:3-isopropylmalate/(R)-2-methylmalate dehydratase small subunit